jgi:hypothetical protein
VGEAGDSELSESRSKATRNAIRAMIAIVFLAALFGAFAVSTPTKGAGSSERPDLPSVALGQESVYRVEIFLLVFYGGLLIGTPAFRGIIGGRLPTKISARGAEYAEETAEAIEETQNLVEELRKELQSERASAVRTRLNIDQIAKESGVELED